MTQLGNTAPLFGGAWYGQEDLWVVVSIVAARTPALHFAAESSPVAVFLMWAKEHQKFILVMRSHDWGCGAIPERVSIKVSVIKR
ncbi:MAG: hypothetical protein HXY43_21880 [Fischerella sp.]|uniref:hypothetical protein n=1 Tax=Fischerella sp. TaxID=1191 RepID=UPI0017F1FD29|nr:hypothetical protein [Fischerella sp.]NWF61832.1 hypothetical protein [Fischerella sp.]